MSLITIFPDITGKQSYTKEVTMETLVPLLTEYKVSEDRSDVELFSGATIFGSRCNANVKRHDFLVIDVDGDRKMDSVLEEIASKPINYVAYTSYSHRPDLDRFRLVLPLDSFTPAQFVDSKDRFKRMFPYADPASFTPSQSFYLPCVHPDCQQHFSSAWRYDENYKDNKITYLPQAEEETRCHKPCEFTIIEVVRALQDIHPLAISYDDWVKIGMGLANSFDYSNGLELWLKWNAISMHPREDEHSLTKKFQSFKRKPGGITAGTIFYIRKNIHNQIKKSQ